MLMSDQDAVDAAQVERGLLVAEELLAVLEDRGEPAREQALARAGRTAAPAAGPARTGSTPSTTDGIASSHSGTVIARGDSWIFGSTVRVDPALAPERQPDQPEHVERGHDRDDDADRPDPR